MLAFVFFGTFVNGAPTFLVMILRQGMRLRCGSKEASKVFVNFENASGELHAESRVFHGT